MAVAALYLFALVLVLSPLVDLLSTVWPPRFGELSWRYGFFGLSAGYLHTPLLGLVLATAVAYWQEHGALLRVVGFGSVLLAGLLIPVIALWPLDFQQISALREEELRQGVIAGGIIQELKYMGACAVLALLGLGALGTAKGLGTRRTEKASPGIVSRT
ncbi:MAG TPA: hypothetical protein VMM35_08275 [Longimicrobiales bacterium]|nr:hypothetical protein [Longimicrobiales bacterium]